MNLEILIDHSVQRVANNNYEEYLHVFKPVSIIKKYTDLTIKC